MNRRELEEMREDGLSRERRREFRKSERAVARWEQEFRGEVAAGLETALAWIDQLRTLFGEPPVDRRPWRGDDFRL